MQTFPPFFLSFFPTLMLVEISGIARAHDSPASSVWPMASGRLPITRQSCFIKNVRGRLIFFIQPYHIITARSNNQVGTQQSRIFEAGILVNLVSPRSQLPWVPRRGLLLALLRSRIPSLLLGRM
jgi:hypothetical protein